MRKDLIDKICEAAFVPDLWPDVIAGLIFAKTGTHQQSQLVALLKRAQPLNGGT
jgi:hypothetical protein